MTKPNAIADSVENRAKINLESSLMAEVYDACYGMYTMIYGEEPDTTSDLWKWYLTTVFDPTLRLAVTKEKGGKP